MVVLYAEPVPPEQWDDAMWLSKLAINETDFIHAKGSSYYFLGYAKAKEIIEFIKKLDKAHSAG